MWKKMFLTFVVLCLLVATGCASTKKTRPASSGYSEGGSCPNCG